MAELSELLVNFGHSDVRTYLQSGNLVLGSDADSAQLERNVKEQILKGLGLDVSVLVRTRDELANVIERDPFSEFADDPKRYQVSFLSVEPDVVVARDLSAVDFSPERVVVSGREIYACIRTASSDPHWLSCLRIGISE